MTTKLYAITCVGVRGGDWPDGYEARSTWAGGAMTAANKGFPKSGGPDDCVWNQPNSWSTSSYSSAETWNLGLQVYYVIGIDLSMQTGFTREAINTFHYSSAPGGGWLCGSNGPPGGSPRVVFAQQYKS